MKNPYISIEIPFFNSEKYLELAIKSILNQTYPHWELILIDDGSSDGSLDIAKKYEKMDERIRVIYDGLNKKLPGRLNQLVEESKYEYVARMDADDVMHPDRLKIQLEFLINNPQYDLVSSGLVSIDNNNIIKGFRCVESLYDDFKQISISYPILHPAVLAKKSWYERNLYSTNYPRAEDFELWTRAIANNDFKCAILPDLLLFYREEGNLSLDKIINSYNDVIKIHTEYKGSFKNIIKMKLKKFIVYLFYVTGNLQMLAKLRNKKFADSKKENYFQNMLNSINSLKANKG